MTALFQGTLGRNLHWSVSISVTLGTLCQVGSVYQLVTCVAFWQDFFIRHPARAIHVKLSMASLTVYPVFAALGLYKIVEAWVTPAAAFWFHVLRLCGIHRHNIFFHSRFRRNRCRTPQKTQAEADGQHVLAVNTVRPTLEDAFVQLTGISAAAMRADRPGR